MDIQTNNLSIGAFADSVGINVETIRFYQREGLLPEPDKPYGSIRRYGETDVARIRFIKSAQRLGFSLDEVADLLTLDDGTHCDDARQLGEQKLADVRARQADLQRIESLLATMVRDCRASHGTVSCPLIAALQEQR